MSSPKTLSLKEQELIYYAHVHLPKPTSSPYNISFSGIMSDELKPFRHDRPRDSRSQLTNFVEEIQ